MITWYLLLALMLFLFLIDYCENKKKTRINIMTVFIVALLTLLSGLRGEGFPDSIGYVRYFESIPSLIDFLIDGKSFIGIEPLYQIVISIFKLFSSNFNLYLGIQSLLLLVIAAVSFRRFNAPVNICLILYFFVLYYTHFGQQRMGITFVLCLFATTYLVRNNLTKFVVTVLVATGFHYVAIFFLPAYWIHRILLSKRVNRYKIATLDASHTTKSIPKVDSNDQYSIKVTFQALTPHTIIKIVIIGAIALLVTIKFDIVGMLFDRLSSSHGIIADNIYSRKFFRSYSFVVEKPNILNAWYGQTAYIVIAAFIYIFRKQWLNEYTAPLYVNFCMAIVLVILAYGLPTLTDRIFRMYGATALIVLFGIMARQRKNAIIILPFIFAVCIYLYLSHIATETGPYHTMGF